MLRERKLKKSNHVFNVVSHKIGLRGPKQNNTITIAAKNSITPATTYVKFDVCCLCVNLVVKKVEKESEIGRKNSDLCLTAGYVYMVCI